MKALLRRGAQHVPGAPALEVLGVTVRYGEVLALNGVSFTLQAGDQLAVVGPNGSGKSTLLGVVAGVLEPTEGEVRIFGHPPGQHTCVGFVPQRSGADLYFPVTVADVVMMGRALKLRRFGWPTRADWQAVHEALRTVGLEELAGRSIAELSGGQRQRAFIARALAQEAKLLLMDEPLAGLDVAAQEDVLASIAQLRLQGVTVLFTTHNLALAAAHFDRVLLLNQRVIALGKPEEVLKEGVLLSAYGHHARLPGVDWRSGLAALDDTCGDGWEQ